jgi:signal transduction histidine kinase
VSRFSPETKEFTDYGYANGYPPTNVAINAVYGSTSYCRTRDGYLVFGTGEGIVIFHPDSIHNNPNRPNVILTEIDVMGNSSRLLMNSMSSGQEFEYGPLELSHTQNNIAFEFAALDYTAPLQNEFSYMLEGLENDWSPAKSKRRAEYPGLSPGSYVFRVRASNNDGVWNEQGALVRITVLPPWWMTWWFRALIGMTAISLIVVTVRLRIRRAVAQERMRWQIASDLHDDIGSSLSSIALVSENIRDLLGSDHAAVHDLDSMTSAARQAAEKLRDDVWVIKPGSDSLENLTLKMKDVTQAIVGHLKHSFNADPDGVGWQVPLEFRRNVLLIHKEALHNILKHSQATTVEISVGLVDSSLTLDIRDNGRGFDVNKAPEGNGLLNMKRRAELLGGELLIESSCGHGTHLHLAAKIPRTRY